MSESVGDTFAASVDEGTQRLDRNWVPMLSTGLVGGIDVGVGVMALLVVEHATGNRLLGALAFGIGFIALSLANSELFTENFLVPVAAVTAGSASFVALGRLWASTLLANLVGGWVLMGVLAAGVSEIRSTGVEVASHVIDLGTGREAFASAVLGGTVITLLTWMQCSTDSVTAKLVAAATAAFVLAATPLNHAIVISLEIFAALHAGAPFGYIDWLAALGWAALGNMVGGLGLVTVLRFGQVGKERIDAERQNPREGDGGG